MKALRIQRGWLARPGDKQVRPDYSAWAEAALLQLFPISGPFRLSAPKNSAAFTLGPSLCCCWQILCQEITKRTAASLSLGTWPQWWAGSPDWPGPCLAKALKLPWPGSHCWGPWLIGQDVTASSQFVLGFGILFLQHFYMCFLCSLTCFFFFSSRKHILNFSCVNVSEAVNGSGNCTNGDPACLGSGLRTRPWIRHFTCWSLISSSVKWGELN